MRDTDVSLLKKYGRIKATNETFSPSQRPQKHKQLALFGAEKSCSKTLTTRDCDLVLEHHCPRTSIVETQTRDQKECTINRDI